MRLPCDCRGCWVALWMSPLDPAGAGLVCVPSVLLASCRPKVPLLSFTAMLYSPYASHLSILHLRICLYLPLWQSDIRLFCWCQNFLSPYLMELVSSILVAWFLVLPTYTTTMSHLVCSGCILHGPTSHATKLFLAMVRNDARIQPLHCCLSPWLKYARNQCTLME